ncbi:MAG: glycosyltransferase family 4 protein [Solirubrobacteraceae bacterium]
MSTRSGAQSPLADVVLVANEVGGVGGMERQLEQLVGGLLASGSRVVVIARRCEVAQHERLRFVRVRCPARPFTVAYPAFFVAASMLACRHRGAVMHTTGAIIANRADVSSVHYCHRAATTIISTSRASRPSALYRLNARIAEILSRAGEGWCYRPTRTKLLCAVSSGLASEIGRAFPRMVPHVRTVPNGVDTTEFRPDAAARSAVRESLGLEGDALVALFVGGDWDRKGLSYAVDALSLAARWHLVVAGEGDAEAFRRRAKEAGVADRLHLRGAVGHMAPLYAAADAFVLPTAYETFSLVTYEAAASGLALLVTRVSGVEDVLRDGSNGWFIERDASDIARRLTALASDLELMRRMAGRARDDAQAFGWPAMVAGYEAAYREVANADR